MEMKLVVGATCAFVIAAVSFYFYSSYEEAQRVARVIEDDRFARYQAHCIGVFEERFEADNEMAIKDYQAYKSKIDAYYADLKVRKDLCWGWSSATAAPDWFK